MRKKVLLNPFLKLENWREMCLYASITYLLSRKMGIRKQMPPSVLNTLINFKLDYESAEKEVECLKDFTPFSENECLQLLNKLGEEIEKNGSQFFR